MDELPRFSTFVEIFYDLRVGDGERFHVADILRPPADSMRHFHLKPEASNLYILRLTPFLSSDLGGYYRHNMGRPDGR